MSAPTITRLPENLLRGAAPELASDVFTCGLMRYELLAGEHPYWRDDPDEFAKLYMGHADKPPALLGLIQAPASKYRCERRRLPLPVTRPRPRSRDFAPCPTAAGRLFGTIHIDRGIPVSRVNRRDVYAWGIAVPLISSLLTECFALKPLASVFINYHGS